MLLLALIVLLNGNFILAQDLNSTNYTLIAPSIDSISDNTNSTNFSLMSNSSPVDDYITSSTNFTAKGGTIEFIEARVPTLICFETSTNSGTTSCTGIPGADGMRGVCSTPGCYDRAKIEINTQGNPDDVKYAIQIATNATFTAGVQYISGTTRFPKNTLALSDFLYKCEWEGTTYLTYCASPNTTYQKYNVLGLQPGTLYYLRIAALKGATSAAQFTQSDWSPSLNTSTQNTTLSIDIDIAPNTSTSTAPPYILTATNIVPETTYTSLDYLVIKTSSNALNGITIGTSVPATNLVNVISGSTIPSFSGDLDSTTNGFGLRNISSTNAQTNSGHLGEVTVSTTPIDYTDTGAVNRVGGVSTSFTRLFSSNSLPLFNGVSAYRLKVRTDFSKPAGDYNQNLVIMPVGNY